MREILFKSAYPTLFSVKTPGILPNLSCAVKVPNYQYQLRGYTEAITRLSLSTKQSGEVDQPL